MPREFTVIVEQDEQEYYVATVPQLHGCHTQATSLDELMVRVKEAIELCLEVEAEEDLAPLQLVGVQRIIV
jgi:predicted RNase H-like HicB family nuclease